VYIAPCALPDFRKGKRLARGHMAQEKKQPEFEFRSPQAPVHLFFPRSSVPAQDGFKGISAALVDFLRDKAMGP